MPGTTPAPGQDGTESTFIIVPPGMHVERHPQRERVPKGRESRDRQVSGSTACSGYGQGASQNNTQSEEVNSIAFTVSDSSCASSQRSVGSDCHIEVIRWDDLRLGHRLQPYRRYAHCRRDIYLLSAFLELAEVRDIDGDSVKLLLRALKLLHLCDYSSEDLCSFLAHSSSYFVDAYTHCGVHMDECEVGNVLVTLMFIAHCYVQDETCPLHVWHQYLFQKYCPIRTLNAAIFRLLEIRHYILRLESEDLSTRFEFLHQAIDKSQADRENVLMSPPEPTAQRHQAIMSKVRGIRKYR